MNRLLVEKFWPYIVALGIGTASLYIVPMCDSQLCSKLLNPAVNVSAIGVGFLGAMLGILVSSEYLKVLDFKEYRIYLISYLRQAIYLCFAAALYSGLLLMLQPERNGKFAHWILAAWTSICTAAVLASYRVIALLFKLLELQAQK